MTVPFSPGSNNYTQGFGSNPENVEVPTYQARQPTPSDTNWPIGKRWIWIGNGEFTLESITTVSGLAVAFWAVGATLPLVVAAGASPQTANSRLATVTFSGVSIAAGASQTFVINDSAITANTTAVDVGMVGATAGSALSIVSVTIAVGTLTIVITNGTGATTDTANITFSVFVQN